MFLSSLVFFALLPCLQYCHGFVMTNKEYAMSLSRLLSIQRLNPSYTIPTFDEYCEKKIAGRGITTHIEMLDNSLRTLSGKGVMERMGVSIDGLSTQKDFEESIYENICMNKRWVLISHGIEEDPIFNFVNVAGLEAFVRTWDEVTKLPSRKSVLLQTSDEKLRIELMKKVTTFAFVEGASGIRVRGDGQ